MPTSFINFAELKEYVKKHTNLFELVKEYCPDLRPIGNNTWIARCPHPDHEDKHPSFNIQYHPDYPNTPWTWVCMVCHNNNKANAKKNMYGTDCFGFVRWLSDYKGSPHILTFPEAVELLAKKLDVSLDYRYKPVYEELTRRAKAYTHNLTPSIISYLKNRGLDKEDIISWQIGAMTFKSGYRITFPIINNAVSKQVIGFSSRLVGWDKDSKMSKYVNSRNTEYFNKSSCLYGIDHIDESFNEIRITEGVLDVVLSNKYNAKNVVATLGTAFSQHHVQIIKKLNLVPVFCLDADDAGRHGIKRAVDMLAKEHIYAKVCILPAGMDMADLANKEKFNLEEYIQQHSLLYWQYKLKDITAVFESKVNELRAQYLPDILQASKGINNPTDKILFTNYVGERFGIKDICLFARTAT